MLFKLASQIFGSSNDRAVKGYARKIAPIGPLEERYGAMSETELAAQTDLFRQRLTAGETLDHILPEAFAVVREAAKRTLGQRHYDVQLIGGMVLHEGKIAEMRTGEGKTLVATLAVYLNAIEGKGVHVVTVNDYLANRDAEWMGKVYRFLGLSVGCIKHEMRDTERRAAYACDITYGTNNEFGFDYLRDNMKFRLEEMVQRPFNYAIVDEVDSILVDEARTPLIISGPAESSTDLYVAVDKIIPKLKQDDYELDEKNRTVILTEDGQETVERLLTEHGLMDTGTSMYDLQNISLVHHAQQALRAHTLFRRDKDYIVKDNKVIIIDEFTGRMMEGRRYSEGLHQALEAKEHVEIQNENQTLASITFQNYFRLYPKLAGMTGTAMTEATEFAEIYGLQVIDIPTNVPVQRLDHEDQIYKSMREKEEAIVRIIKEAQEKNQPVLVGTVSIERSEQLSERLKAYKIKHNVLNARYHEQEAYIIAQAGRPGAVTIATNMAGRGTDIKPGGDAELRAQQEIPANADDVTRENETRKIIEECARDRKTVMEAGGLFVIGTERHESRRIDNQLRGRSGRQGDPGASIFFLSLEDDLMRIFGSDKMEMLLANKQIGLQDGESLTHPWISKALERAQARVEGQNFEVRKNLLKFDNVMNDQRKVVYEQRRDIMAAKDVEDLVREMRFDLIEAIVHNFMPPGSYADDWDTEGLDKEISRIFRTDLPVRKWAAEEGIAEEEIVARLMEETNKILAARAATIGPDNFRNIEKSILLQEFDRHWKEHLLQLDHLRQGINLRAFGQKDPLNEYKAEAFEQFEYMLDTLKESVTETLFMVDFSPESAGAMGIVMPKADLSNIQESRNDPALAAGQPSQQEARRTATVSVMPQRNVFDENNPDTWSKTPRNAACPCGSGKKYKYCHGALSKTN